MNLFSVKAPLIICFANGESEIMAERYPHPDGLVYVPPFWHQPGQQARVVKGKIEGVGPWKIGTAVVRVLSCGDRDLNLLWNDWQQSAGSRAIDPEYEFELGKMMQQSGAIL